MMHGSGTTQSAPAQTSAVLPGGNQEADGVVAISRSPDTGSQGGYPGRFAAR